MASCGKPEQSENIENEADNHVMETLANPANPQTSSWKKQCHPQMLGFGNHNHCSVTYSAHAESLPAFEHQGSKRKGNNTLGVNFHLLLRKQYPSPPAKPALRCTPRWGLKRWRGA